MHRWKGRKSLPKALYSSALLIHGDKQADPRIVGSLFYQGLVTASFGFVAWNTMLKKYGAVSLHSFIFIMPIAGVALGGLVLGEPITVKILLALAFIVSGILVVNSKTKKYAPLFPSRGI